MVFKNLRVAVIKSITYNSLNCILKLILESFMHPSYISLYKSSVLLQNENRHSMFSL